MHFVPSKVGALVFAFVKKKTYVGSVKPPLYIHVVCSVVMDTKYVSALL